MFEEKAEYYDSVVEKYHGLYSGHYTLYRKWYGIFCVICDRLTSDDTVLDLGCGAGHLAHMLHDSIGLRNYTGIDFSTRMIDIAKSRGLPYDFIVKDVYDYDWADWEYDVVISTEFVEHVTFDMQILAHIKSGTIVIFTTTNEPGRGHVRYFLTEDSVYERYESLFYDFEVLTLPNMLQRWGMQQFYICEGERK